MSKAGLIVNPRSGKSSGKGLALAAMLQDSGAVVKIIEDFNAIESQIAELAGEGVTDLFISSGDGTIQAIQTIIAERGYFQSLPRLSLLSHGTTNMTAADLGFRRRSVVAQAEFIGNIQPTDLRARPTIRCANPRDGRPRHGMFLGAGAVAHATRFTQQAFNSRGLKGNYAIFITITGAVLKYMFTKPGPHDESRFDRPYSIAVEADGRPIAAGQQLLWLATTLEQLVLYTKPFWGKKTGPIRTTVVPYPFPSVARWLIPAMYGGEDRRGPPGAASLCATELAVTTSETYVIDGEFFLGPEDGPLRVETGPVFTYIRG